MNPNPILMTALAYIPTGLQNIAKATALPTEDIDPAIVYVLTAADGGKPAGSMWLRVADAWVQQTAIPCRHRKYAGTATTYITFFAYADRPTLHASGKIRRITATGQIDLWTTSDIRPLYDYVTERLRAAGIKSPGGVPDASVGVEDDATWYHGYIEFGISEDVDKEVPGGYGESAGD